jgi:hypothetical protein
MAKKSHPAKTTTHGTPSIPYHPPSTEEFQAALARAATWADLRASDAELAELADLIHDPRFWQEQAALAAVVQRHREELVRHGEALCAQMDWRMRAIMIEGAVALETARRHFLPERGAQRTDQGRRDLFALWLTVRARKHGVDPAVLVGLVNTYSLLGPHALRRLLVDVKQQLGLRAGVIPLLQEAVAAQAPGAAADLDDALQVLVKLAWKHLSPTLRSRDPEDVSRLLASALGETLVGRVNPSGDAVEAAIRGLEGSLNNVPEAVANRASKDARRDGLYRTITVTLKSSDEDEAPSDAETPLATLLLEERDHTLQRILAWIEADPTRKAAYRALTKERTQADLAKKAGISEPTFRKHIRALQRDLRRYKPFFS